MSSARVWILRASIVFALTSAGALASSACSLGCIDPDPDCHGDYDHDTCACNHPYSTGGTSYPYSPPYPSSSCYRDVDCPALQTCGRDARCHADPAACAFDQDCPAGARCFEKSCECNVDDACGEDGGCPAPLVCNERTLECVLGPRLDRGDAATVVLTDAGVHDAQADAQADAHD